MVRARPPRNGPNSRQRRSWKRVGGMAGAAGSGAAKAIVPKSDVTARRRGRTRGMVRLSPMFAGILRLERYCGRGNGAAPAGRRAPELRDLVLHAAAVRLGVRRVGGLAGLLEVEAAADVVDALGLGLAAAR